MPESHQLAVIDWVEELGDCLINKQPSRTHIIARDENLELEGEK